LRLFKVKDSRDLFLTVESSFEGIGEFVDIDLGSFFLSLVSDDIMKIVDNCGGFDEFSLVRLVVFVFRNVFDFDFMFI